MGPLFLFFLLFFSRFLSFFLLFIFSFFNIFCSFLHFFDFLMFFIFFSAFLFSCISVKYFYLLALVSEFNCFLRSRCSMEMWCPDDIGRESWDWVGPPGWGRACFNSPEWSGGSSPVKTEPLQIALLLLLLLFWTTLQRMSMASCGKCSRAQCTNLLGQCLCTDPYPPRRQVHELGHLIRLPAGLGWPRTASK